MTNGEVLYPTLRNFTPHPVAVYDHENNFIASFESEGSARLVESKYWAGIWFTVKDKAGRVISEDRGIPLVKKKYTEVENLPAPEEGVIYIVSFLVLDALRSTRDDLIAPDTGPDSSIRDEDGRIIGIRQFQV
jgi:hypothetical protein